MVSSLVSQFEKYNREKCQRKWNASAYSYTYVSEIGHLECRYNFILKLALNLMNGYKKNTYTKPLIYSIKTLIMENANISSYKM